MPISRSRDERTVLDLFTEIAIVEHLLRNRYDQSAPAGMTTGQFGILTHFIRGGKSREKLSVLAWMFQDSEDYMAEKVASLVARGLLASTPSDQEIWVEITDAGREMHGQALAEIGDDVAAVWHFHPFELNPQMPPEGENSAEHIQRKYGRPPEEGAAARSHIKSMGENLGFTFKGGPDSMIWNTFDCHRLLHWAERAGKAHALKMALFEAHFTRAEPLNSHETLIAAAVTAGLDASAARDVLTMVDTFTI